MISVKEGLVRFQTGGCMVPESLLRKNGARVVEFRKGEVILQEGSAASHFTIVKSGKVKMANISADGKEFVQGYFTEGQSFGEPPFFTNTPYPASAIAVSASSIWKCPRDAFLRLLRNHFDVHLKLTQVLSGRLVYKSMMLSEIAINEADHRLMTLIRYMARAQTKRSRTPFVLPLTRQQLADMTGLRVETVIRSIKSLERKKLLSLDQEGKIHYIQRGNDSGGDM
jgi:CRP-like cAMP-binding protein